MVLVVDGGGCDGGMEFGVQPILSTTWATISQYLLNSKHIKKP